MCFCFVSFFLFNSLQLIKLFNQDVSRVICGEEHLFGNEIRLFAKLRKEFQTWGLLLLENAAKGKYRKPSFTPYLREDRSIYLLLCEASYALILRNRDPACFTEMSEPLFSQQSNKSKPVNPGRELGADSLNRSSQ